MAKKRLDIHIDFERGGLLPCPTCGTLCKAYDTTEDSWRHLNFFQHSALLHARVPRVDCDKCHAIRKAAVPWARTGSGFTLLFEALVMALCQEMPVLAVADLIGEHDTRIWRVLHHYVKDAVAARDLSDVKGSSLFHVGSPKGNFPAMRYAMAMRFLSDRYPRARAFAAWIKLLNPSRPVVILVENQVRTPSQ